MNREKTKLYRKVNTKASNVRHHFGGDFCYSRHTKRGTLEQVKGKMYGKQQRGLDYTPLYRFLLSKVGGDWDGIFSEAKSRLDKTEPIFLLVAMTEEEKKDLVCIGDNSYYSGLFVDENNLLQICNPELKAADMKPFCVCCTHTLNGVVFGAKS